ncbi:hypothetical protein [Pararobbsia alpina]|uniref:Uncharacterized protein n=1 Tax=Pararobbsia alpina TaxID=621374 RepID=A0A6S7C4W7_9BURK|nr:hypothetical protein [Pararobbsia alpina]CAB3781302.1 hypothetical protein LMG28138_01168 [Pararobbsia alpina]
MDSRELEGNLLARCAAAAHGQFSVAQNQREANVFRVAAMVVQHNFPQESSHLMDASNRYFGRYPGERLSAEDVVRNGWIFSFPRLRDMLTLRLRQG